MIAYAEVTPLAGFSPPATEAAFGARAGAGRGFTAVPFVRGGPFGRAVPFARWTPFVRAGAAAMAEV